MAGPSSISGVVPGIAPGGQAGDVAAATSSIGKMMMQMVQMHEVKKQHSAEQLESMMKKVEAGFPIDPKAIMKTAKAAGMPVMGPDDMKAHVTAQQGGGGQPRAQMDLKSGDTPADNKGAGPGSQMKPVQNSLANKEKFKSAALDHWYQGAMQKAQTKGMTDQALLEYGLKVAELKQQAAGGDNNAVGKLMSLNEIPFSIDRAVWGNASDSQKQGIIDMAAGRETEKEFNGRRDHIMDNLTTSGKFKDPDMARKAADALAHGHDMPSDVKAAMVPNTFKELGEQATFMGTLIDLGVPAAKVATTATAASIGGLQNALPTGLKPLAVQTMALRAQEVGIEKERLGVEKGRVLVEAKKAQAEEVHWQAMAAGMDAKAQDEHAKAALDQFKSLAEAKKAGIKIDDSILTEAQAKVGKALGIQVEEVNNFFHWVTGGTHYEFKPKAAESGMPGSAGKAPTNKPEPGFVDSFKKVMKGIKNIGEDGE